MESTGCWMKTVKSWKVTSITRKWRIENTESRIETKMKITAMDDMIIDDKKRNIWVTGW